MNEPTELCCPLCGVKACTYERNTKKPPPFCPMESDSEQLAAVEREYLDDEELRTLARESARTEAAGYCRNTRIEEIMDFARRIGATKLGIAHCVGLMKEARTAYEIFCQYRLKIPHSAG